MEAAENDAIVEVQVQQLSLAAEVAANGGANDTQNTSVLKMKGLPFSAQENDLREFFAGFSVVKAAVHIGHDGRPSGLVRVSEALGLLGSSHSNHLDAPYAGARQRTHFWPAVV